MPVRGGIGHAGAVVTAVGGLLTLLAFVALPLVTFLGFGATGLQAAVESSSNGAAALVIWLVPIFALVIAAIGLWQRFSGGAAPGGRTTGSIIVIVLGLLTAGAYVLFLIGVGTSLDSGESSIPFGASLFSFLGIGFWLGLLGMVLAVIGAIVELGAPGRAARAG